MELEDYKRDFDKDFQHNEVTREQASDDLVFYLVTQWDDNLLSSSNLQYRGQFDILRKAGRQILSHLEANPIQIDFEPKDQGRDDAADLVDGVYRTDDMRNTSIEAYQVGKQEAVVCGTGAWLLYTDYETSRGGDLNQVIKRKPLHEANNKVFWDANAKLLDKSDAMRCTILHTYTPDAYRELVAELTGVDVDEVDVTSFKTPEQSYVFPWYSQNDAIYVGERFTRQKVKDKLFFMLSPFNEEKVLRESDVTEIMDELIEYGFDIVAEKEIERWQVTRCLLSGAEILDETIIAGEHIPVVPMYGERGFVEDEEYYEGITRLAKDPQRLRNFQMSYLADIVSRSPRPKPIFYPEQVQGFESMYEENGSDNNYPYLLQNRYAPDGSELPLGVVAQTPEQTMPQALIASIDLARQAVEDVANPGLPQDIADPDLSGKAIYAMQNRLDNQSMIYQTNWKHAKRRDAEVYASMAADIMDTPREVTITLPDGRRKKMQTMTMVVDEQTGNPVVLNDIRSMEFEVFADVGPSYSSQKEQEREEIKELLGQVPVGTPEYQMLLSTYLTMIDGIDTKPLRDYANKQLVLGGFKEPETEEEMMMLQQAQAAAAQQQDPIAQAAQAEAQARLMEGQAALMNEENDRIKLTIDKQKADNDSAEVQIKAAEAGVKIDKTQAETENIRLEGLRNLMSPIKMQ